MSRPLPRLSARSPIGAVGIGVSPVCVGSVGTPGVVRAAFDAGINFFAIAVDMHWPLYEPLRRGLADLLRDRPGVRDEIVVMGVAYGTNPRFCHAPFTELLDAVPSLGRLDVSAMGAVSDTDFLTRWNEHAKHRAGSIPGVGAVAAYFEGPVSARVGIDHALVDLALVANRPSAHASLPDFLAELSVPPRVPVFAMGVTLDAPTPARLDALGIGDDKWRPTTADYVRYALSFEPFSGLLREVRDEREIETLDAALRDGQLTSEEIRYLEDLSDLDLGLAEIAPE